MYVSIASGGLTVQTIDLKRLPVCIAPAYIVLLVLGDMDITVYHDTQVVNCHSISPELAAS